MPRRLGIDHCERRDFGRDVRDGRRDRRRRRGIVAIVGPAAARRAVALRSGVNHAFGVDANGVHFLVGRVEHQETLARAINAEHASWRSGADQQLVVRVERHRHRVHGLGREKFLAFAFRRNLVDDALVAGRGEDVAGAIHGQRPDVLVVRIEERGGLSPGVDLVDASIGRSADVNCARRRRRQRVHFHLAAVVEHRAFAGAIHANHLAVVTGAEKHRPVGRRERGPYERHTGVVNAGQLGAQRQAAVLVNRQLIDIAAQEIGLGRRLPEARRGRQRAHGEQAG